MENVLLQSSMKSFNSEDYMLQKKLEVMMDINNKKLVGELNNLKSMVSQLNEEISEIKRRFSGSAPARAESAEPTEMRREAPRESSQANPQVNRQRNDEDAPKPRYGDYKPGDVDINKIFYFGSKR